MSEVHQILAYETGAKEHYSHFKFNFSMMMQDIKNFVLFVWFSFLFLKAN